MFPLSFLSLSSSLLQNQFAALNVPKKDNSQIEGPSIANSYGFKVSMQNLQDAKALHEVSCRKTSYPKPHCFVFFVAINHNEIQAPNYNKLFVC